MAASGQLGVRHIVEGLPADLEDLVADQARIVRAIARARPTKVHAPSGQGVRAPIAVVSGSRPQKVDVPRDGK